jgi:lysozyme
MARRVSEEALSLIKRWEGLKLQAYRCPADVWTIGYGHTATARPGMVISETQATRLLMEDLARFEAAIERLVRVPLSDGQFGALVSWCFNVGDGAAARSSLIRKLNGGDYDAVPAELARWNKVSGKVVPGLANRRAAEAGLWARGSHVASASVNAEAKGGLAEAARSGTGRAALGVGAAGVVAQLVEALGAVGPAVGIALVVVAAGLFILWRAGRL